jgi:hypothetical protein
MSSDDDRVVPFDELTTEDLTALGWAFEAHKIEPPAEPARTSSGEPGVRASVVAAVRAEWDATGRPKHDPHRTSVTLIDGTEVVGATFVAEDPYTRDTAPTFGLYLDERWNPPWTHSHVDWPDFELPRDTNAFIAALRDALDRARRGERVELGCWGGHGRTGTGLACLAVLAGTPASEALAWVRENYCEKAVETAAQEQFVLAFDPGHSQ